MAVWCRGRIELPRERPSCSQAATRKRCACRRPPNWSCSTAQERLKRAPIREWRGTVAGQPRGPYPVSKHPRRPTSAPAAPWRPQACRFRPAARSPAGAPAIETAAATTNPGREASVPTPRPRLPAADSGGVRGEQPVERGVGGPYVDGTGTALRGRDGRWTWCVRGAMVPASRTTDVCLEIDPGADSPSWSWKKASSMRSGAARTPTR